MAYIIFNVAKPEDWIRLLEFGISHIEASFTFLKISNLHLLEMEKKEIIAFGIENKVQKNRNVLLYKLVKF